MSEDPFDIDIRRDTGGHIVVSLPAFLKEDDRIHMPDINASRSTVAALLKRTVRQAHEEFQRTGTMPIHLLTQAEELCDALIELLPEDPYPHAHLRRPPSLDAGVDAALRRKEVRPD